MTSKDTFKRKEKKFLLTYAQYEELLSLIGEHVEPDEYPHSDIHSVYYDTPNHDIINRSLEKPVFKEKLRVRDYGTGQVFVELKKKYKGIVYKRRVLMPAEAASAWLDGGKSFADAMREAGVERPLTFMEKQVSAEVDFFVSRYDGKLTPAMDIHADRYSFRETGVYDPVRITFDVGIWYDDLRDAREVGEVRLTEYVVMETKIAEAYPLWLAQVLSKMHLFPTSFSKYGTAYKIVCASEKEKKTPESIVIRVKEPANSVDYSKVTLSRSPWVFRSRELQMRRVVNA